MLSDGTLEVFQRLKRRRLIHSKQGQPYRVSRLGITTVRAQLNQR
ncbi:MAG: YjhX family toxin [Roseovarius indicus]